MLAGQTGSQHCVASEVPSAHRPRVCNPPGLVFSCLARGQLTQSLRGTSRQSPGAPSPRSPLIGDTGPHKLSLLTAPVSDLCFLHPVRPVLTLDPLPSATIWQVNQVKSFTEHGIHPVCVKEQGYFMSSACNSLV